MISIDKNGNVHIMKYILSIFFIVSATLLQAQDVRVTIDCPQVVRTGEPFQMAVQVNADATNIKLPEMSAFTVLRNYGRSQSSQVSIINGKVSQSMEVAFNYIMQANREGTQEIAPVEVTVDGKTCRSAPVTVQVIAGNADAQPQQGGGNADAQQVQAGNRDVFVEVLIDHRQVYQGEYINATVKLFSTRQVGSINNVVFPTFDGFFKQEIETPPLRSLNQENINGVPHLTGVLRNYVLFPQKSGTLVINPCTIEVGINERVQSRSRSIFDDFFGGGVQTIPREATSRPVNITVLPLPEGKPASFSGGVGQMKFEAAIDKTEVKANDPVTLKITVSGNGNMRFVDAPRINFPPDFEVYDPKVSTNLNATATAGSKTFEYLIIPRHGGTYRIPAAEFSYFDPQAKQYKTLHSDEYTLAVERGEEQPGTTVISGVTREDVQYLGKDIRYLKTGNMKLRRAGDIFFSTWKFWLWYLIPLCGFFAIVYLRRKYIRKYANVALMKNRKASRYAAKRLKQARTFMDKGQTEPFYEELSRALWGYLGDKMNIPVAELSKDNAKAVMEQHGVDAALADEFTGVIDDCEFARYAPAAAGSEMNALYVRAVGMINRMQKAVQ
jgi:hypothetical protein